MSSDRKRQKKLERKTARRKEKKQSIIRQESGGLPAKLAVAAKHPILHCRISAAFEEQGIASLILSREFAGQVAVAVFLIDRWCLGIKDAWGVVVARVDYDVKFHHDAEARDPRRDIAPADACKLVYDARDYARSIGFQPHPEFARVVKLFGDIEPTQSSATFEFGHMGKPHYFAGPHDSMARSKQVIAILEHHCGQGNYHYTIPLGGDEGLRLVEGFSPKESQDSLD